MGGREPGRDVTARDPIRRLGGGDRSLHTGPSPLKKQNPHTPGEGRQRRRAASGREEWRQGGTAAPAGWGRRGGGPREARAGCPGAPTLYFGGVGDRWVWGKKPGGRREGRLRGRFGGNGSENEMKRIGERKG